MTKRERILQYLDSRPYSSKNLARIFNIDISTVRRHIHLLRREGHDIYYNSKTKMYNTKKGLANHESRKKKRKGFIKEWLGPAFSEERMEETWNKLFKTIIDEINLEEKSSEFILRFLIMHGGSERSLPYECTFDNIRSSLGMTMSDLEESLEKLIQENIIEERRSSFGIYYWFMKNRGFQKAIEKGWLTIMPSDVEAVLSTRLIHFGGRKDEKTGDVKTYGLGSPVSMKFFMGELLRVFLLSFMIYDENLVPRIFYNWHPRQVMTPSELRHGRAQGKDDQKTRKGGLDKSKEMRVLDAMVDRMPMLMFVDVLNEGPMSPRKWEWFLEDFKYEYDTSLSRSAAKNLREINIRYLLAWFKPLYCQIREKGSESLLEDIVKFQKQWEENQGNKAKYHAPEIKPSKELTASFLILIAKVFHKVSTQTFWIKKEYIDEALDYAEKFKSAAKNLTITH